jgi:hypothetical protein
VPVDARGTARLLRWIVPLVAILAVSACSDRANSGLLFGTATGRVLAAPSDCMRASTYNVLSDFGYMCFAGPLGKPGACVSVRFSNGGQTVAGVTRLPSFGSTSQPDGACTTAVTDNFGLAAGLVSSSDPRCMAVALPFPGTKAGQLCGNISLGAPGDCASVLYKVSAVDATPEVQSHSVLPSSACDGLVQAS